ncbi:lycopene cyclase domain-containing protein [Fluviicola taffensis]|uniref:Lycopene cyclase domain protein n=1 Tax=Fluviicola taffensis (strain DSM 16823 / NCIMB 13979 / RW262) TaxID=755732 RepID=F2IK06_FLUTR|nr:lycopene cyclase domain-containing protein [Fluviicola taffensis]AEA42905.1 lycopene cyclase domain protein [Fluviicola taffensis DSM 16823]
MSLYLWIILGTIVFPFLLSFDKKIHFYTHWKTVFPSIFMVGLFFLVWDSYFTLHSVWGFNPRYVQGIYLFRLPLEEVLFFLVVPYACLFVYEVIRGYLPNAKLNLLGRGFAFAMVLSGLLLAIFHLKNWYTLTACSLSTLLIIGVYFRARASWFNHFALAFLICLVPFLLVNGALTGFFTPEPVVWYSENHIVGIRIGTIPLEDLYYNLSMLLPIVLIHEVMKAHQTKKAIK